MNIESIYDNLCDDCRKKIFDFLRENAKEVEEE